MAEVKVGGTWLQSLGHVSGVTWSTRWGSGPCGPDQAGCRVDLDRNHDGEFLRLGASFEVWEGGVLVFGGYVVEVGRDYPRTVRAKGWGRRAEVFDAMDGTAPTTNPRTAATTAIANGLPWRAASAFPNVAYGTAPGSPAKLNQLLTDAADRTSSRWGVDAYALPFWATDSTTVDYHLDGASVEVGLAEDGLYSRVRARYATAVEAGTGTPTAFDTVTVTEPDATFVAEYSLDLTDMGVLTAPVATDYANAQLALLTRPRWMSAAAVTADRLISPGGVSADLTQVRAGQVVRLFNVPQWASTPRGPLLVDVVLGEVSHDAANPAQITIAPMDLAARTLRDFLRATKRNQRSRR